MSKDSFNILLTTTMSESLILFDQEFYKQHDEVPVGTPLGPKPVNVFLCYHEKTWLQNCSSEFKIGICYVFVIWRYVDDIVLLFRLKHNIEKFWHYLMYQHKNIRFTSETENKNSIFLTLKKVGTVTNSGLQLTANRRFYQLWQLHPKVINTTCCLPYYTEHSNIAQALDFSSGNWQAKNYF